MQEPSSGWKWNTNGRVEDHIPRAEVGESLVEASGARATSYWVWTHVNQWVWTRLKGAVGTGILFFPLGPPVLKPDFDLGFGQTQWEGQVQSFTHGQIPRCAEFVLQSHQLLVGESCSGAPRFGTGLIRTPLLVGGPVLRGDGSIAFSFVLLKTRLQGSRWGEEKGVWKICRMPAEDRLFLSSFWNYRWRVSYNWKL